MGRTKQQALDTRAKIIEAAERVIYVRGFARASLEDIASEAGVTRGAVYGHFRNKEAVFQAIYENADMPLDPFVVQACEQDADPLQHLHAQLRQRLRDALHMRRARRLYSIALTKREVTAETAAFYERVSMASLRAEAQIDAALRAASERGQLPPGVDTRAAAGFIHAALTGFLHKRLLMSGEPRVDGEADQTLASALRCIGAQTGFEPARV
ncbi:TetR family transcriptional regulator [Paraburkholderia phymatum]|uniref:Transcriptional regulator, TetR family n=1 Tax=Paraburkholderia phymatum (strain DSM 17167 / CIP 108236 / LMG 21445 / STM815) TaxID=391038 RepID=B2JLK9_PARP8|nr:TetR family transcriptional regulator [Paraburkholderia phymatum]ACC72642.1 transcriptional regulator, TetR family [Paraburkholderia phymatum STM815]